MATTSAVPIESPHHSHPSCYPMSNPSAMPFFPASSYVTPPSRVTPVVCPIVFADDATSSLHSPFPGRLPPINLLTQFNATEDAPLPLNIPPLDMPPLDMPLLNDATIFPPLVPGAVALAETSHLLQEEDSAPPAFGRCPSA